MSENLEDSPDLAAALTRDAHRRLMQTVSALPPDQARAPSRLPGWTVGHVLTHLARNADGHARRLAGSLVGEDRPKYPGGGAQRADDIEQGATRDLGEMITDLETSQARLEALFDECAAAGWPHPALLGGETYGPRGCPAHRLREIEMHHVDLGVGYEASAWSDEYVAWELSVLLETVDARLRTPQDRRHFVAWLAGRGALPGELSLEPWG